ncbi:hypothetical protein [Wolbachia endosymbiont (group A) of Cydia splendana]|nr:hypothetical protein [Wolbachia endosymbiont (group A) of Cydia splendana]
MSVATRFFQLLCNKAIPVSRTGMTAVLRHTAANRHTAIHSRYLSNRSR